MRNIPGRLKAILHTLLRSVKPVPVKDLAEQLRVSRRTVFRELANTESLLNSYGLNIGTKPGEGIFIEGDGRNRDNLRETLEQAEGDAPADRRERQARLVVALVQDSRLQKLFQYADNFGVSVATISNDLDEIETWLADYKLTLVRKTGSGVSVSGEEMFFRRALLAILRDWPRAFGDGGETSLPETIKAVAALGGAIPFTELMTPQSKTAFESYVAVAVRRIESGRILETGDGCAEFAEAAGNFANLLEKRFAVAVNAAERNAIALELCACCLNADIRDRDAGESADLLRLAHRLVDGFDAETAPLLKLDDALLDGLLSYLQSAVVRLRHRIELRDPLSEQMSSGYSEVMAKTRRAARALADIGDWLPDTEVSLLATHFGAAVSRLSEQMRRGRNIRVGVVCIHGLGTSYLLASQARKLFGDEARFEVGLWSDTSGWQRFDFLISTTPVPDAGMPVVVVPLILTDESVRLIREEIGCQAAKAPSTRLRREDTFSERCRRFAGLASDARLMFTNFCVVHVEHDVDFAAMADMVGDCLGVTGKAACAIRDDLLERERLSTQVLGSLKLVMLHCRTEGAHAPVFALVSPAGGGFGDPYFQGAKAGIVMLIPKDSPPERADLIGAISTALVNNEAFLADIMKGDGERVRLHLEDIVGRFLEMYVSRTIDGDE